MRRILLACPLKGQLSSFFVKNLVETCRAIIPGVTLEFSFLEGAPVQQARNEIVDYARRNGFNELIQMDKDLDAGPEAVARLASHDVPVVCALYSKRSLDTFWHVQTWSKTQKPHADGLLRVKQCAIGFSKIKLDVFDKLQTDNPDRLGILTDSGGIAKPIWEFFPMELVGPNTPAGRLAAIKELVGQNPLAMTPQDSANLLLDIQTVLTKSHSETNLHTAEDYSFCRMCRESDIPIMVDTQLTIQHETGVMLPIPTPQLEKMLDESWRG